MKLMAHFSVWFVICHFGLPRTAAAGDWVVYEGQKGPGQGKQIVFLSGDEEYRSEEALPMLAKILAVRHGFKCTVLFPINETTVIFNEAMPVTPADFEIER